MDSTTWAYIAGLLDGEGSFTRDHNGQAVRINVNMTDKDVVEWLHQTLGGRLYARPPRLAHHKPQWAWRVSTKADVERVLRGVRPYLRVKARQADLMLDFLSAAKVRNPRDPRRVAAFAAMDGMNGIAQAPSVGS